MSRCRVWYWPNGKVSITHVDLKLKPVYVQWGAGNSIRKYKKYRIQYQIEDLKRMGANVVEEEDDVFIDFEFNNLPIKAPRFAGLDYEDMDTSQLPVRDENRNKWRGSKGQGVRTDDTVVLRRDLFQQIDNELAKPSPDMLVIERLRRKLEKREHDN